MSTDGWTEEENVILDTYMCSPFVISYVTYTHGHTYIHGRVLFSHEEGGPATRDVGAPGGHRAERDEPEGNDTLCVLTYVWGLKGKPSSVAGPGVGRRRSRAQTSRSEVSWVWAPDGQQGGRSQRCRIIASGVVQRIELRYYHPPKKKRSLW